MQKTWAPGDTVESGLQPKCIFLGLSRKDVFVIDLRIIAFDMSLRQSCTKKTISNVGFTAPNIDLECWLCLNLFCILNSSLLENGYCNLFSNHYSKPMKTCAYCHILSQTKPDLVIILCSPCCKYIYYIRSIWRHVQHFQSCGTAPRIVVEASYQNSFMFT